MKRVSTLAIYDFNTDIIYKSNFERTECTPVLMSDQNPMGFGFNDSHHIRLKNTKELFFKQDKTKTIIYTGTAKVRGIDADVWIEKFKISYPGGDVPYNFTVSNFKSIIFST